MKNIQILTPISIVIAGALIAFSIYSGFNGILVGEMPQAPQNIGQAQPQQPTTVGTNIKKPNELDHIRGNKNAKVTIVEYSDLECPFCKKYHETLKSVTAQYGKDVAWVYRHFPLTSIHKRAMPFAVATECAAKLNGNQAFWDMTDAIFSKNPVDVNVKIIAAKLKINEDDFDKCLSDSSMEKLVDTSAKEAIAVGVKSTPTSFIVTAKGVYPLVGAVDEATLKANIDKYLNE
jgi:protein-disulfide isomerase